MRYQSKQLDAPARSDFPQGPQPEIASLRDLQKVGAHSDFSLVQSCASVPRAIYLPVAPSLKVSHRGGLARSYFRSSLAFDNNTKSPPVAWSSSVPENIVNLSHHTPSSLIPAFLTRHTPTWRQPTMLSGLAPAQRPNGKRSAY